MRKDREGRALCERCFGLAGASTWQVPWEAREQLGLWRAWGQMLRTTMFAPSATFAGLDPARGGWWDPVSFALFANLVMPLFLGTSIGLVVLVVLALSNSAASLGAGIAIGLAIACGAPVVVTVRVFALAGVEHLLLMLQSSARRPFDATLRAHCYSSGPAVFALAPLCGPSVSEVWQIVLRVYAYRSVHEATTGKVLAAVLVPVGLLVGGYLGLTLLHRF